jgi:protein-disulfide isomerase
VAEAAEAARSQGKYWEFVSLVFANQSNLKVDQLKQIATQLGLNRAQFDQALASGVYRNQVQMDLDEGVRLGLDSAPAYFLNGKRIFDSSYDALKGHIQAALKRVGN